MGWGFDGSYQRSESIKMDSRRKIIDYPDFYTFPESQINVQKNSHIGGDGPEWVSGRIDANSKAKIITSMTQIYTPFQGSNKYSEKNIHTGGLKEATNILEE